MKTMYLTFEDKEHKTLKDDKKTIADKLRVKRLSWHDYFILKAAGIDEELRKK